MNHRLENRIFDAQRLRLESDLAERVQSLFGRWPLLQGFSVGDAGAVLAEVSCYPSPGAAQADELCSDISRVLFELVDERPEAADLLRGRSFARTLH